MNAPTRISATSPLFEAAVARIAPAAEAGKGLFFLFAGGTAGQRLEALGHMRDAARLSLHQVDLGALFDERQMAVQGNLREVFDTMGEQPSILCFDNADAFFRADARQDARDARDPDALTARDYLFSRIEAFVGAIVLCLADAAYAAEAVPHASTIVTFEDGGAPFADADRSAQRL